MSQCVAIIGLGAIAQDLVQILCTHEARPDEICVLVHAGREDAALATLTGLIGEGETDYAVVTDLSALLAAEPDVVVECAGHGAVAQYAADVLAAGVDFVAASVGALADADLDTKLRQAATESGAQIVLPAGAIGGIDALAAARLSGLREVTYTGRKPPAAWMGSPAEKVVDLSSLAEAHTFFEGTAREAATQYPKNANVAATLALAGLGMDETQVRLIADPAATTNSHEYSVASEAVDYSMTLTAKPAPRNPKTSASTVYSIARAVLNRATAVVI